MDCSNEQSSLSALEAGQQDVGTGCYGGKDPGKTSESTEHKRSDDHEEADHSCSPENTIRKE